MVEDRINQEAVAWQSALESDEADWDGFTRWLEADPAHRRAYDELARVDDLVSRHRATLAALLPSEEEGGEETVLVDRPARRGRRWGFAAGGVAAALLAPLLLLLRPEAAPPPVQYATAAGETRDVALGDGTRIALSAASSLQVGGSGSELSLKGAALFDVPHRADRIMIVRAGGVAIQDIGTRFEVSTAPGMVRIAVAEGRLSAQLPGGQRIAVAAGRSLIVDTGRGDAELTRFVPRALGAWTRGRLVYDDVPLALVAADVGRFAGVEIRINPDVSARRFSGILNTGNGSGLVRTLAQVMDLDARREGKAVRLLSHSADPGRRPAG